MLFISTMYYTTLVQVSIRTTVLEYTTYYDCIQYPYNDSKKRVFICINKQVSG